MHARKVSGVRLQGDIFFYEKMMGVLLVTLCALIPFPYLNFTNRVISPSEGGMAYKEGFKKSNKTIFVCWGVTECSLGGLRGKRLGRSGRGLYPLYEWLFDCEGRGGVKFRE
jgi:hypothetical protein